MSNKEIFVFYRSYNNAIQRIQKPTLKLQAYEIIINYGLYGDEPQTDNDTLLAMFELIKPIIDNNNKRRQINTENGRKGGAPKGNKNASKKQPNTSENNLKQPNTSENKPKNQNKRTRNKEQGIKNKEQEIKRENKKEKLSLISSDDLVRFKSLYPNKEISELIFVPQEFNFDLLLEAVSKSDFLKNCNNLSLQWLVDNYGKVIRDEYQNYTKDTKPNTWQNMKILFEGE